MHAVFGQKGNSDYLKCKSENTWGRQREREREIKNRI